MDLSRLPEALSRLGRGHASNSYLYARDAPQNEREAEIDLRLDVLFGL